MSRFSLKKFVPDPDTLKKHKSLRLLGALIEDPNLFHLNRRSVSRSVFWGLLIGLLPPVPVHTPLAAVAALIARCNLPLILTIIWVSNPITIPLIIYSFYSLGRIILHTEAISVSSIELSWAWLSKEFLLIWKPYLVGTLIGASTLACSAYFASNFIWRLNTKRKWHARKKMRETRRHF